MLRLLAQSSRSAGVNPWTRAITVVDPEESVSKRFELLFPTINFRKEDFESWIEERYKRQSLD
jgi:hypothetical protein